MKVVVVGGGLIGLLSALELRQSGLEVVVVEQGTPGRESSWAGGGILSPIYPWKYDPAVNALAKWSQQQYPGFAEQIYADSGVDPEWTQSGMLVLDMDMTEQAQSWAADYGLACKVLDNQSLREVEPNITNNCEQAMFFPDIAQMRNPRLVRSLYASCIKNGIKILDQTRVTALNPGSPMSTVQTDKGDIEADHIVIAGGAWSRTIVEQFIDIEIKPIQGQMIAFQAEPGFVQRITLSQSRYIIPRRDGHVLCGSTLEDVGFEKTTTQQAQQDLRQCACEIVPGLEQYPVAHHWSGLRPASPDGIPYICAVPGHTSLWLNTGHFRNGVVMGLASARLLADLVTQREPVVDPEPYSINSLVTA